MKITHRIPTGTAKPGGDPVPAAYAAEVEKHTAKAEQRYRRAQANLARALARLATAEAKPASKANRRALRIARELVEIRRRELQEIEALMTGYASSSTHRTRTTKRPIPGQGRII